MPFNDAQLSEVTIVLDKRWEDRLQDAVEQLRAAGVQVSSANDDNSVVEGVVATGLIHHLEKMECVDYVRTVFSWVADYPAGDPRDKDGRNRDH